MDGRSSAGSRDTAVPPTHGCCWWRMTRGSPRPRDAARRIAGLAPCRGAGGGCRSSTSAYEGWVPADIVVASGLFSHIPDDDVRRTIETLPMLCATERVRRLDQGPLDAGPDPGHPRAGSGRPVSRTWRTRASSRGTPVSAWLAWARHRDPYVQRPADVPLRRLSRAYPAGRVSAGSPVGPGSSRSRGTIRSG